ncbi:hypothetical protein LINGRAPRIM_LOCUS641 [Linum grandiflorum]
MIQLLLTVLFSQMAFIIVLVFKSPLRKLAIMGLDRLKRGRGGLLFLALMIDRLHHYMRELRMRRKDMEALRKQMQKKALQEELTTLRSKLKQLETEMEVKAKEVNTSKANVVALRKQSDGFVLEYDRLLEENQLLRNKLKSLDLKFSRSGSKKDS